MKSMGPLEPLKIDSPAGFYYLQNISPQSRAALAVQSPSPQPRVIHSTSSLVSENEIKVRVRRILPYFSIFITNTTIVLKSEIDSR